MEGSAGVDRENSFLNCTKEMIRLYAVTDRAWLPDPTAEALADQVEQALRGGVTLLQLREKNLGEEEFLREARLVRTLCRQYHVPLIVNDSVRIAKEADADGVHLGRSDTGIAQARRLLGPEKIIGASARTVEQARLAERQGADYLGVGAVFPTGTKRDARQIDRETLREICRTAAIPVAAIGGITAENVSQLAGSGISGIAVVSALFAQQDIERAAGDLLRRIREVTA